MQMRRSHSQELGQILDNRADNYTANRWGDIFALLRQRLIWLRKHTLQCCGVPSLVKEAVNDLHRNATVSFRAAAEQRGGGVSVVSGGCTKLRSSGAEQTLQAVSSLAMQGSCCTILRWAPVTSHLSRNGDGLGDACASEHVGLHSTSVVAFPRACVKVAEQCGT